MASLANLTHDAVPAASSGASVDACSSWSLKGQLCQRGLWIFIIVAVVVLVVLFYLCCDAFRSEAGYDSWWKSLGGYSWGESAPLWVILMVVGVLLFAWAAFTAYTTCADQNKRNMIIGGFGLSMLSLVALFSVFFRKDADGNFSDSDFSTASWVAVLAAVLGFACLYPMWQCHAARLAMIPYLVWVVAVVIYVWDLTKKHKSC